jgi:predicted nucleotide-binding protein
MDKPRIFLGSSGKQEKLLQALTRGLSDIARVEPWTTSFNPGTSTLERLLELTREVDFAAFVFAQDDWTTASPSASSQPGPGQASPRDNVVFEAGLFGGVLECAGLSSSMQAGRNFQATSWASPAFATPVR